MRRLVAVDGPAGSGKSTLGLRLAHRLVLPFIDTGVFYRAVALTAAARGVEPGNTEGLVDLARTLRIEVESDPAGIESGLKARVDGVAVGTDLYDAAHLELLARVSGSAGVREALLEAQRAPAAGGAVAAGRDCGTVVFPEAQLKVFLTAPEALRSQRRAAQLLAGGRAVDAALLSTEIGARDRADSSRVAGPLRPAPDAHMIDTQSLGIDDMVEVVLALCAERGLMPA